jgi:tripartite-type tricarboxylate transporter receptor subunit TctC
MMKPASIFKKALLAFSLVNFALAAYAQTDYPKKPIKIIVPFEPGGTTDTLVRIVSPIMSTELGQPVIVENRGGANSIIGTNVAARSAPDGYTLLIGTSAMSLNSGFAAKGPALKLPYNTTKDLEGVALLAVTPYLLLTNSKLPIKSVKDLVAKAKAAPGEVPYGSSGTGGSPHLGGILLGMKTGADFLHVAYKGSGPAMVALLQGQVHFTFASFTSAKSYVDSGQLKILAVAAPARVSFLPDVPTIGEAGAPGAEVDSWFGLLSPAGTPLAIRERIANAAHTALSDPKIAERLVKMGAERPTMSVQQFDAFFKKDVHQWGKFIQDFDGSLN